MDNQIVGVAGEVLNQLPAEVKVGAFKALNRLLGAAISVPEAYLRRWSQGIDDKTNASSSVWKKLGDAVGERAMSDEAIMERATQTILGDAFRKQLNRDAVATEAAQLLLENHREQSQQTYTGTEIPPPSDDWLNIFVDYAERASSENLRVLWAKILAGEIRSPGKFSPRTMRFIAELDPGLAKIFEEYAPKIFGDFIFKSQSDPHRDITRELILEDSGILTGASGSLSKSVISDPFGIFRIGNGLAGKEACFVTGTTAPNVPVSIPALILTRVGKEVAQLLPRGDPKISARPIAEFLGSQGFQFVDLLTFEISNGISINTTERVFPLGSKSP